MFRRCGSRRPPHLKGPLSARAAQAAAVGSELPKAGGEQRPLSYVRAPRVEPVRGNRRCGVCAVHPITSCLWGGNDVRTPGRVAASYRGINRSPGGCLQRRDLASLCLQACEFLFEVAHPLFGFLDHRRWGPIDEARICELGLFFLQVLGEFFDIPFKTF